MRYLRLDTFVRDLYKSFLFRFVCLFVCFSLKLKLPTLEFSERSLCWENLWTQCTQKHIIRNQEIWGLPTAN